MGIQCNKCASRNTIVVKAKDLAKRTSDNSVLTGMSGTVAGDPAVLLEILKGIVQFLGKLFGWLEEKEKNDRQVVVCQDCGYWERV